MELFICKLNERVEKRIINQIIVSAELEGISEVTADEVRKAINNALLPSEGVSTIMIDNSIEDIIITDGDNIIKSFTKEEFMELFEDEIVQTIEWIRSIRNNRRVKVDYRYDPNRWIQLLLINEDTMDRIINDIASTANADHDTVLFALLNELLNDNIDGTIEPSEPIDDIRIVNGHQDRTFKYYTEFSFMVEYKDRVLRAIANE
jgi:hypothetical protein